MRKHYDAIVIGAGQAGPALTGRLNEAGMKTAVIERQHVGGTCVNVGCIPTKTFVGSARVAYLARQAHAFGIDVPGPVAVDMARVKARKDEIVAAANTGLTEWLESMDNVDFLRGHARFVDNWTIAVNGEHLEADRIFLDVGARARVPDWGGLDDVPYLTNSTLLDLDTVPEHLLIIGGSYVGLEFAQMYRRFGSRVTVIEMQDRLIGREDEDISDAVREILEGEGISVRLNAECLEVRATDDGVAVRVSCKDGPEEETGSHLLVAVGRAPNTGDLGLENTGVEITERGHIKVDDYLRTAVPHIHAMGEANGRGAFTHTSYNDYEIVAASLFDNDPRKVTDRIDCYGLFIDPPLGRAGLTERDASKAGYRTRVGKRPMTRVGRAKEFGETRGFMKVVVDADSDRILGAAILGLNGDEAVHCLLDVMYTDQPYTVLAQAVHIHPTVTELIPTVLQGLE